MKTKIPGKTIIAKRIPNRSALKVETVSTFNQLKVETVSTFNKLRVETVSTFSQLKVETPKNWVSTFKLLKVETVSTFNCLKVETAENKIYDHGFQNKNIRYLRSQIRRNQMKSWFLFAEYRN